jgi:hypothetical protein
LESPENERDDPVSRGKMIIAAAMNNECLDISSLHGFSLIYKKFSSILFFQKRGRGQVKGPKHAKQHNFHKFYFDGSTLFP